MMETLKLKTRVGDDGPLVVQLPSAFRNRALEVVLVLTEAADGEQEAVDANGWHIGFFDRTAGSMADDPIERPPQAMAIFEG